MVYQDRELNTDSDGQFYIQFRLDHYPSTNRDERAKSSMWIATPGGHKVPTKH